MRPNNTLRPDITTSQDLSAAALDFTTSIPHKFTLLQVLVQADIPITETITVTLDSGNGAAYDTILATVSLSGGQSFVYKPEGKPDYQSNDNIKVECTNANGVGVVSVIVKIRDN